MKLICRVVVMTILLGFNSSAFAAQKLRSNGTLLENNLVTKEFEGITMVQVKIQKGDQLGKMCRSQGHQYTQCVDLMVREYHSRVKKALKGSNRTVTIARVREVLDRQLAIGSILFIPLSELDQREELLTTRSERLTFVEAELEHLKAELADTKLLLSKAIVKNGISGTEVAKLNKQITSLNGEISVLSDDLSSQSFWKWFFIVVSTALIILGVLREFFLNKRRNEEKMRDRYENKFTQSHSKKNDNAQKEAA